MCVYLCACACVRVCGCVQHVWTWHSQHQINNHFIFHKSVSCMYTPPPLSTHKNTPTLPTLPFKVLRLLGDIAVSVAGGLWVVAMVDEDQERVSLLLQYNRQQARDRLSSKIESSAAVTPNAASTTTPQHSASPSSQSHGHYQQQQQMFKEFDSPSSASSSGGGYLYQQQVPQQHQRHTATAEEVDAARGPSLVASSAFYRNPVSSDVVET